MRASFLDVLCAGQSRPSLLYTMPEDSWYVQGAAITQERRRSWSSMFCRSAASYVGGYRLVASSRILAAGMTARQRRRMSGYLQFLYTASDTARPVSVQVDVSSVACEALDARYVRDPQSSETEVLSLGNVDIWQTSSSSSVECLIFWQTTRLGGLPWQEQRLPSPCPLVSN